MKRVFSILFSCVYAIKTDIFGGVIKIYFSGLISLNSLYFDVIVLSFYPKVLRIYF